ncbi:hypothetical protein [Streptomyces sp. NPDC050355]|uniref:hypothetical protein n=1 Tax=Streptomyces sp. NPDC050355 TaxID=3365609 RepID=UPI003795B1B7
MDESTDAGTTAGAGPPPPPAEPPPTRPPAATELTPQDTAVDPDPAPELADEPADSAPSVPAPRPAEEDAAAAAAAVPTAADAPAAEPADDDDQPWWSKPADAVKDSWAEHGPEAQAALREIGTQMGQAAEIGAQIGDAIADRLDPNAAAQRRGLDIGWLHLGLNVPALAMAVAAWVWGVGPAAGLVQAVRVDGMLAPLGWVVLVVGLLGFLSLVPIGSVLASAVANLVMALVGVVRSALARGWRMRYVGYLLRLVLVTLAWVVVLGIGRFAWRLTLTWLTGV